MPSFTSTLTQLDQNKIEPVAGEIIGFACVRNESVRLPYFLEYYRMLGVSRFIIIDNASTDGTRALLRSEANVHVFYTEQSYSDSNSGVHWINHLLSRYGCGHWVLVADADELFVYPRVEDINLPQLTAYLDRTGAQGIQTFLIDMYATGPIQEAKYVPGSPFLSCCPYFDGDSYVYPGDSPYTSRNIPTRGGARLRLFWEGQENQHGNPPFLPKVPLVKWRRNLQFKASTHLIDGIKLAELTGVLLHFKLFSKFVENAFTESKRGEYWDNAVQYSAYANVLRYSKDLTAFYEGSVRYRDSMQLVALNMATLPDSYAEYVSSQIAAK